jgi:hypothetical protein
VRGGKEIWNSWRDKQISHYEFIVHARAFKRHLERMGKLKGSGGALLGI